jgi:hypothetical protein
VVRSAAYHLAKTVSHAPVALYVLGRAREPQRAAVMTLRDRLEEQGGPLGEDCRSVIAETLAAIDEDADLLVFARRLGPVLVRLRAQAITDHLDALDAALHAELTRMTDGERATLQVVVAGVHQAREHSLGMQYFRWRLSKGCPAGERVLYAEGVHDEGEALRLVAAQRLDREIALAFFGDASRLQRDVLGDITEAILKAREYRP